MQQTDTKRQRSIRFIIFLSLFLLTGLLSACLGGGETTPEPVLGFPNLLDAAAPATLTCTAQCAETGQCGSSAERGQVVLLNTFAPKTENHDMAVTDNTVVTIVDSRDELVKIMSTNDTFGLKYYYVTVPERPNPAWVAGFCIQGTPVQ